MDCSICSSMPFMLRPPRNTICGACFEGAKSIIALMNTLEGDKEANNIDNKANTSVVSSANSCKLLVKGSKWLRDMKEQEAEMNKKIAFLSEFGAAFRDHIHTDIKLMPANNGPPLPAHKALLAARSKIFKHMLDSDDGYKAAPSETIKFQDLNREQLESLLVFLYTGSLPADKMEKNVCALFLAGHKYEIQYLQDFCERHMFRSLSSSNALDVLEISDACQNKTLKDAALNFIIKNKYEIAFTAKYDSFVRKNPHLCVQLIRAFLLDVKCRRDTEV